jgi:hypothetical protein
MPSNSKEMVLLTTWQHEPQRMSKAIIFWSIAFTWLLIDLLFIGIGEFSLFDEYEEYRKATPIQQELIRSMRYRQGLPETPEEPKTNWVRWFSWRLNGLYLIVFCPSYSFWVIYKAIVR